MSTDVLAATGFLGRMKAMIFATEEPTYTSAGVCSWLDYFVVDLRIAPMVESVAVVTRAGLPVTKHVPCVLTLAAYADT